jgi:hypothetical protein
VPRYSHLTLLQLLLPPLLALPALLPYLCRRLALARVRDRLQY